MYIDNWSDVPIGDTVFQDTYNEVYEVIQRNGKRWLKQIGWRSGSYNIPNILSDHSSGIDFHNEFPCDFDPNSSYDQPWIHLNSVRPINS